MTMRAGPAFVAWLRRGLAAVSVVYAASAITAACLGSYSLRLGPLHLSSRSAGRDLAIAAAAGLAALLADGWPAALARLRAVPALVVRTAPAVAALGAAAVFVAAWTLGSRYAGGSDSSGYLSEAALWLAGSLHVAEPTALAAPWPAPDATFAPLAFRPATSPGAYVPVYPPGFPLTLAAFEAVARTRAAAFAVVPLAAAACVYLVFLLGRRLHRATTGLWGALLLAVTPTFAFQALQPMSDVPATAWWLAATLCAAGGTTRGAWLAGLSVSAAVLTRPNLLLLAVVPAASTGWRRPGDRRGDGVRRLMLFAAGALPGPLAVALVNRSLYGSSFSSGYGSLGLLFSPGHAWPNLAHYAGWLIDTHAWLVLAGVLSPVLLLARRRRLPAESRLVAWHSLALAAALCLCYLFYVPFDNWTYLRFLLPAIALLLPLGAWVVEALAGRLPAALRALAVVALGLSVLDSAAQVRRLDLLRVRDRERRYFEAADYVRTGLPRGAVVIGLQLTGSVHYYAAATTLRYDALDPAWLDRAVETIDAWGRRPVVLLEDWEVQRFRERFGTQGCGRLDWPPQLVFERGTPIRLWDASGCARAAR